MMAKKNIKRLLTSFRLFGIPVVPVLLLLVLLIGSGMVNVPGMMATFSEPVYARPTFGTVECGTFGYQPKTLELTLQKGVADDVLYPADLGTIREYGLRVSDLDAPTVLGIAASHIRLKVEVCDITTKVCAEYFYNKVGDSVGTITNTQFVRITKQTTPIALPGRWRDNDKGSASYVVSYQPYVLGIAFDSLQGGRAKIAGSVDCRIDITNQHLLDRAVVLDETGTVRLGEPSYQMSNRMQPGMFFNYLSEWVLVPSESLAIRNGVKVICVNKPSGGSETHPFKKIRLRDGSIVHIPDYSVSTPAECCPGKFGEVVCIDFKLEETEEDAYCDDQFNPCKGSTWNIDYTDSTGTKEVKYNCINNECVPEYAEYECVRDAACAHLGAGYSCIDHQCVTSSKKAEDAAVEGTAQKDENGDGLSLWDLFLNWLAGFFPSLAIASVKILAYLIIAIILFLLLVMLIPSRRQDYYG